MEHRKASSHQAIEGHGKASWHRGIEAVAGRGYLGVDRKAGLLRQIARHRALIDEPADIAEQVIDSAEPTETTPRP